jgi:CRP-like cAMP-binding protein
MASAPRDRCAICNARSTGLLCALGGRVRDRFQQDKAVHRYRRGQMIFFAGSEAHALYIMRSGRVKVFRAWHGGKEQVLRLHGPGDILGYRPLLANERYNASAEAVEDSTICVIPAATLQELLREVPELSRTLLAKLARELRNSEDLMMDLIQRPVRQRTARLLLRLLDDYQSGPEPAVLRSQHLRRQDMARMIGTTPETLSRVLRGFARRGVLAVSRDQIRIRDHALLRKVAGESPSG